MRIEIAFGVEFQGDGSIIFGSDEARDAALRQIVVDASIEFGGCNLVRGLGGWKPYSHPVLIEQSATLTILSDFDVDSVAGRNTIRLAKILARSIQQQLKQESVLVTWHDDNRAW